MDINLSPEIITLLLVAIVLAGGFGFFWASSRSKKEQATTEVELTAANAQVVQCQQQIEEQSQKVEALISNERSLELDIKQAHTELENSIKRQAELIEELQQANQKAEAQAQMSGKAATESEAAKVELKEVRGQQENLNARLVKSDESVAAIRCQLDDQAQATADQAEKAKGFEVSAEAVQKKWQDLKQEKDQLANKYDALQERFNSLISEYTELKTSLDERDASHKREVANFEKQKSDLKTEFKVVSEEIIEQRQKALAEQNKEGVGALLKPLQEQLGSFQKRVNEVHTESVKGSANLESEIKKVLDVGLKMRDEASNLTSALKGDSQKRGAWGEAQLERTLEMSGLIEDAHYEKQSPFKDADGKQKQTDYLIKLPDNKHIIIDSKVQLVAYDKAVAAETPEEQALALDEHVKAVKANIDDLVKKDYTNLIGMRSPSFVLMFIPIEPAYIEALKNKKDLFNYGYEKGIVLVSHTTLIPILRTIANLWMMEQSNQEAREISEKAGDIYNQVCTVAERLLKVGTSLKAVSNNYNSAVTSLVGQQGLHGKVDRFNQLSSKVSKSMPALEPAHIDFETERLTLAAEPIKEEFVGDEGSATTAIPHQQSVIEET